MSDREFREAVVIGAGQAGVSLSYALRQRQVDVVVLERHEPFHAWKTRWSGFHANTPNWMNSLRILGLDDIPGQGKDDFATGEELVEYFDGCLTRLDLPIRTGVDVTKVVRGEQIWEVHTSDSIIDTPNVGICTGAMSTPWRPETAADVPPTVPQLHSHDYTSPDQITTSNVLLVGSGASGVQICRLLAESGRFNSIHIATSKVLVLPRSVLGVPVHRAVHAFGLFDVRTDSLFGRAMYAGLETRGDPIMKPTPTDLARQWGVNVCGRFSGVDGRCLRFDDGKKLELDDLTIIWCTGLRGDYSFLVPGPNEDVLDERGFPRHDRGVVDGVPGLYFVGLRYQSTSASHDIYGVGKDADFIARRVAERLRERPMRLVPVPSCCVCGSSGASAIAAGRDYEYVTGTETHIAKRCDECSNIFLDPRPDVSEFERIYPPEYHSLEFTSDNFSLVHRVRSRLEARRLLRYCDGAPCDARILDVGCGDGFHLALLGKYGNPDWTLEGIDLDPRAVQTARRRGITVHEGTIEDLDLEPDSYDVVISIQTIEHVAHPDRVLRATGRVLKPGGRLVIVTDNTRSLDFSLFSKGYWGSYHFPRHWNLFNADSLSRLARTTGFDVEAIDTIVSPVNWVYSVHNALVDKRAPRWLVNRFTLKSPVSLGIFTLVDTVLQLRGRGALLNAYFRRPAAELPVDDR